MYPPTGTHEDILSLLARGCPHPDGGGAGGPIERAWEHSCILMGEAVGAGLSLAPQPWAAWLQDRLFLGLEGKKGLPFDEGSPAFEQAAGLDDRARRSTGRAPALLCLLSHPPVSDGLLHLNLELARHAMTGLLRIRPRCRPRLVNAVDHFATDMLRVCERGLYCGFMGTYHLGIDRLTRLRSPLGRRLLRAAAWPQAPFRIGRSLLRGKEIAMVLGGGVPATGRIMYGCREFLHRLREGRPSPKPSPREVLGRLLALSEDFGRFADSRDVGEGLKRSAWRMMEAWVVSRLTRREALLQADDGVLSPAALTALIHCARAFGWSDEDAEKASRDFAQEYSSETPRRARFFRFLARRFVARGVPIVLLPLTHGRLDDVRMRFGEPALLIRSDGASVKAVSAQGLESDFTADGFSRSFVRASFR